MVILIRTLKSSVTCRRRTTNTQYEKLTSENCMIYVFNSKEMQNIYSQLAERCDKPVETHLVYTKCRTTKLSNK